MSGAFWRLWGWPIGIGLLSLAGLIGGLVADGWGDATSWIGLGVPVLVIAWHARNRRSNSPGPAVDGSPAARRR
jgi:hypothetical protein